VNLLQAVNATLRACSEAEVAAALTAPAGSVGQKFTEIVLEAYRMANTMRRWPWAKGITTVTAGATADLFIPDPNLLEVIAVTYSGSPLSDRYTYEELLAIMPGGGQIQSGVPTHFAMRDFDTLFVYPRPTDVAPETLVQVYGYSAIADPATDATALAGPSQYHDAIVQLAYAIAKDKHFGSDSEANSARLRAEEMFRVVFARSRRNKALPRIRV